MDGDTLLMLSTTGSIDQLITCGFNTVKKQMRLRKLLAPSSSSSMFTPVSSSGGSTSVVVVSPSTPTSRKLKKKELNDLSPQDKTVYLMM